MHFGSSSAAQQDTHPAGGSLTAPSPALEGSGGDDPAPCATPAAPVHPSAAAAAAASGPAAAAEAAAAAAGAADFDDDLDISAADLALMQELNIQVGVLRVLVCTHKNSLFHCTCRMLAHCTSRGRRPHSLTFKNANGVPSRRSCLRSRSISFSSCCWKRAGVAAVAPQPLCTRRVSHICTRLTASLATDLISGVCAAMQQALTSCWHACADASRKGCQATTSRT